MLNFQMVTFEKLRQEFGVTVSSQPFLPVTLAPVAPAGWLQQYLDINQLSPAVIKSVKGVSEFIVAPILSAVKASQASQTGVFSGEPVRAAGLVGTYDFVVTASANTFEAQPPLLLVAEISLDFLEAIPQCAAKMLAARTVNEQAGFVADATYGCVTSGIEWQFLRLTSQDALVDPRTFYYPELADILGAFNWIVSQFD